MADTALKTWVGVPAGSRMEVWLESESDQWGAGGRLVVSKLDGTQITEQWNHDHLHPGPRTVALEVGKGYTVRIRVGFTGKNTANVTIRARIVKPGGGVFGSQYAYVVAGKKDDVARSTIIAVVKQPEGT